MTGTDKPKNLLDLVKENVDTSTSDYAQNSLTVVG